MYISLTQVEEHGCGRASCEFFCWAPGGQVIVSLSFVHNASVSHSRYRGNTWIQNETLYPVNQFQLICSGEPHYLEGLVDISYLNTWAYAV